MAQDMSSFKQIDIAAAGALSPGSASVRNLSEAVLGRLILLQSASPSIHDRLFRSELAARSGGQPNVQESALAGAVDRLAASIAARNYYRTTGAQLRVYRLLLIRIMPRLLTSPSIAPPGKAVGDDLFPSAAVFLGFALLHQKIANPAFQTAADEWIGRVTSVPFSATAMRPRNKVVLQSVSPEISSFLSAYAAQSRIEASAVTSAIHGFLDNLGCIR